MLHSRASHSVADRYFLAIDRKDELNSSLAKVSSALADSIGWFDSKRSSSVFMNYRSATVSPTEGVLPSMRKQPISSEIGGTNAGCMVGSMMGNLGRCAIFRPINTGDRD